MKKLSIKKGDKIIVLSGRDKGKTGIVDHVIVKTASVLVEGVNIVKKHVKVSKKYPTGGVVEVVKPLAIGKVELICPNCGKPTRVSYVKTGTEKNRVCKKCKKTIVATKVGEKTETKKTDKKKKVGEK